MFATVAGASAAHADRKMLVLIDASGSMSIQRADLQTRFDAAKARALDQIGVQAGLGLDAVAVYTFSDTTSTLQTPAASSIPTSRSPRSPGSTCSPSAAATHRSPARCATRSTRSTR
ncbi:MAG TPA: VWA domain-containing protein [Kofleriaceae bacterium]|nr:VWA domain-containing protein [Kofleriaceae bacterium]